MSRAIRLTPLNRIYGTGFFVQVVGDKSSHRTLHSAIVANFKKDIYSAKLQDDSAFLESGDDIFVYYKSGSNFACQPAQIVVSMHTPSGCKFTFQLTGDTTSGESRQCYRVSTMMAGITATFGNKENCKVVDVSATGFAVITSEQYMAFDIIETNIHFESKSFCGKGRIQSSKKLSENRYRYGVHCIEGKMKGVTLRKGLQYICAAIQRQHLSRISRTA